MSYIVLEYIRSQTYPYMLATVEQDFKVQKNPYIFLAYMHFGIFAVSVTGFVFPAWGVNPTPNPQPRGPGGHGLSEHFDCSVILNNSPLEWFMVSLCQGCILSPSLTTINWKMRRITADKPCWITCTHVGNFTTQKKRWRKSPLPVTLFWSSFLIVVWCIPVLYSVGSFPVLSSVFWSSPSNPRNNFSLHKQPAVMLELNYL